MMNELKNNMTQIPPKNKKIKISIETIEFVGMSEPKNYVNKVRMGNSKKKIKQGTSI